VCYNDINARALGQSARVCVVRICLAYNDLLNIESYHDYRIAVVLAVLGQLAQFAGPLTNKIGRDGQRYTERSDAPTCYDEKPYHVHGVVVS